MNRFNYIPIFLFVFLFSSGGQLHGQEKFVQLSGIITDKLYRPVPGAAVISRKLHRGAISERTGIYSITTTPGDTVFFRALGYKRYHTIIPENYEERHCMADIILEADTIQIEEVKILPWKNYTEFIRDITKEMPVDTKVENMNENLASIYVAISNQTGVSVTPEAGYRYAMRQNYVAMTSKNMYPVNNLLNPMAWASFVKEVKKGLLKNKSFTRPEPAKVLKKKKKPTEKK